MATTKIWCVLVDHTNKLKIAPFRVSIPISDPDFLVDDLKNEICGYRLNHNLSEVDISVWRCEDRNFGTDAEDTELKEKLAAIDFNDGTVVKQLSARIVVEDLKIGKNEYLIVRIPGTLPLSSRQIRDLTSR